MFYIWGITFFLVILYLAYPLWLLLSRDDPADETEREEINDITVILLSYNGKKYLKEKIDFLMNELSAFRNYELLIIDDHSTDGSSEIIESYRNNSHIRIFNKNTRLGIPNSMNLGTEQAKYEYIIFCDQRQKLSANILMHIVEPLRFKKTGAVSGCISHHDNDRACSFLRKHENFLKSKESLKGKLMGVYGPFYAIKKQCYHPIPDYIILDDLYLSLKILKSKQIVFRSDCEIIDENIATLYDYYRARRYLTGFLQILTDKKILHDLSDRHMIMLIWHKYLRLLIPFFMVLSYISLGFMILQHIEFLILFVLLTFLGIYSLLPLKLNNSFRLKNMVRINIFYFIAFIDVLLHKVIWRKRDFYDRAAITPMESVKL